jgi:hypothetical protein
VARASPQSARNYFGVGRRSLKRRGEPYQPPVRLDRVELGGHLEIGLGQTTG